MTSRFRFAPPARADGALLPAALAALLGAMALAQLALTDPVDLPEAGPIGGGAPALALADPGSRGVPPSLGARALFSPARGPAAGSAQAAADPLGGAAILGSVAVGRARFLVVQQKGVIRRVAIGGAIAGWRVIGVSDSGALLARGRERLIRPFNAGTPASGAGAETSQEDQ